MEDIWITLLLFTSSEAVAMRWITIPLFLVLGAGGLLFGWSSQRPPVPDYTPLGEEIDLDFSVQGIEGKQLELGLVDGAAGALFLRFEVEAEGGHPMVTLNRAGGRSSLKQLNRAGKLPTWPFLQSGSGESVLNFAFRNQLVELEGGKTAVRMVYTGPDVPLLSAVEVGRPTTLPPFIGAALGHDGPVQLLPGTYAIDENVGVMIRANLLGR